MSYLAYNCIKLGEVSDIIACELDGVKVCILAQVLQLVSIKIVSIQFDLYSCVYEYYCVLFLVLGGQGGLPRT